MLACGRNIVVSANATCDWTGWICSSFSINLLHVGNICVVPIRWIFSRWFFFFFLIHDQSDLGRCKLNVSVRECSSLPVSPSAEKIVEFICLWLSSILRTRMWPWQAFFFFHFSFLIYRVFSCSQGPLSYCLTTVSHTLTSLENCLTPLVSRWIVGHLSI